MNDGKLPRALIGLGALFIVVMAGEITAIALSPRQFDIVSTVNFAATLPFVFMLLGSGYWLQQEEVPRERYRRIIGWIVAGFTFLVLFFTVIAVFTQEGLLTRIGVVRWGAAAGAGSGALAGVFEARAIERAVAGTRMQIRNEELSAQNDRLEEFARILSHDLRNPLNVASGHLDLAREEHSDDHFEKIANAHYRMEQIIEETLVLARSGLLIDETEPVELFGLVNECWQTVGTENASLQIESSATVVADPNRLRHLFENLIRNAVEHGGGDVTISVGSLPGGFYLEDDGPGIPEDKREIVLESGYSTKADGTGFGLAIVSQIVEAHGWELTVTDGTAGGVRFEITGVETESAPEADARIGVPR